ncbi:ACT domain-containing protein ACR9-like isoform X2 [Phragmites australis]|uniref:ACT domain-containing protein ACR9-like isoform X2 n=1 Tax=Phragmites australis TaxID=29695 RepID=UPI002D784690|nr:ACT domain-containing protein ACR9-like isoform X2 [Phragmites australis]
MVLGGGAAAVRGDDAVVMQLATAAEGEETVITVNCPDQAGLGCDLCRTILEFGLRITRGDVSTDGHWCFVVFWVVPRSPSIKIRWASLKNRLMSMCPSSYFIPFYHDISQPGPPQFYLLKLLSPDRKGLLHDVTHILSELELIIHRVKVSTTPDGRVVDLFFITDGMELLHTKERQEETCSTLTATLDPSINCEILSAEGFQQGFSSLPPKIADELFRVELAASEICSSSLSAELKKVQTATINFDNYLSPAHTLLQIICADQKGLIYDILRTLKDCSIQIFYSRFRSDERGSANKGCREVDLFIKQVDGKKVIDPEKQDVLRSRLRSEMLHPLRVMIVSRGPDTELLVANPVELSGKGRPRVFYDATLALKALGICIFSAEIGRQAASERQWEVYRFLLDDSNEFPLANSLTNRNRVVDRVRKTLMGCYN